MTRTLLTLHTGSISRTIDANTGSYALFFDRLCSIMTGTMSDGKTAWELTNIISTTTGSRDRVYHSIGDRTVGFGSGDADIWIRMQEFHPSIILCTYQDWAPFTASSNSSFITNPAAVRPSTTLTEARGINLGNEFTDHINYWVGINEYGVNCVVQHGNEMSFFGWERPNPPAPTGMNGYARLRTALTGTGTVTAELDRNISGTRDMDGVWQLNQRVMIVEQAPDGTKTPARANIVRVASIDPSGMKANFATSSVVFSSGSLIGTDPMAVACWAGTTTADPTLYFPTRVDEGYTSGAAIIGDFEAISMGYSETSGLFHAMSSPLPTQQFVMFRCLFNSDQAGGLQMVRGESGMILTANAGGYPPGTEIRAGNLKYLTFGPIGGAAAFYSCLAMGPFAV